MLSVFNFTETECTGQLVISSEDSSVTLDTGLYGLRLLNTYSTDCANISDLFNPNNKIFGGEIQGIEVTYDAGAGTNTYSYSYTESNDNSLFGEDSVAGRTLLLYDPFSATPVACGPIVYGSFSIDD